eukprot:TRINITY_DN36511_c0_g1_i1.p1 TRINITY_DN36511_c0_g1~~TRINITY_DN36511_c0_g1_i1.p1  ORF type:complete len:175 (-),score=7.37 TRINITY_DN36511_c0_g1_i1:255-779(-)
MMLKNTLDAIANHSCCLRPICGTMVQSNFDYCCTLPHVNSDAQTQFQSIARQNACSLFSIAQRTWALKDAVVFHQRRSRNQLRSHTAQVERVFVHLPGGSQKTQAPRRMLSTYGYYGNWKRPASIVFRSRARLYEQPATVCTTSHCMSHPPIPSHTSNSSWRHDMLPTNRLFCQ